MARSELARNQKLAAIASTVPTLGHRRVKPSVYLRPVAQRISQTPAINTYIHAMRLPPFPRFASPHYSWRFVTKSRRRARGGRAEPRTRRRATRRTLTARAASPPAGMRRRPQAGLSQPRIRDARRSVQESGGVNSTSQKSAVGFLRRSEA